VKRSLIVLLALLCAASFVFAADKPLFAPGNLTVQAGLGSGFLIGGVDVYGGVDFGLGSFEIAKTIPLTYGVAGRVGYWGWSDSIFGTSYSYSDLALGALGTAHVSWRDILPDLKWLEKFESYIGLGLGTYIYNYNDYYSKGSSFHLGPAFIEGNNWYFSPKFAINLEEGYYGYSGGYGRFGILFKL
jgi:hypothetical protein